MYINPTTTALALATAIFPLSTWAVTLTNDAYTGLAAGKPFKVSWNGNGDPVNILLETGPSTDLTPVATLASSATGTSTSVTIPSDLKSGMYAFKIVQGGAINYSPQFSVSGSSAPASSSSPALSLSTASAKPLYPTTAMPVYPPSTATGTAASSGTGAYRSATGSIVPFINAAPGAGAEASGRWWTAGLGAAVAMAGAGCLGVGVGFGLLG